MAGPWEQTERSQDWRSVPGCAWQSRPAASSRFVLCRCVCFVSVEVKNINGLMYSVLDSLVEGKHARLIAFWCLVLPPGVSRGCAAIIVAQIHQRLTSSLSLSSLLSLSFSFSSSFLSFLSLSFSSLSLSFSSSFLSFLSFFFFCFSSYSFFTRSISSLILASFSSAAFFFLASSAALSTMGVANPRSFKWFGQM